jgi:GT2 family glycosyltransferase
MELSVSVVLITFNSARYLQRCADGIQGQTLEPVEILVVDNGSNDGSADLAAKLLPGAKISRNSVNTGYCRAANEAIGRASGDFILLLNPDVFLNERYLERLTAALAEGGAQVGSATGKLLRGSGDGIEPTGIVDSLGIRFTRSGRHFDIGSGEPDTGEEAPLEVFGVSGAAALHRRRFLDDVAVGGHPLDDDFFAYREDADLAWRGRLFGWSALFVPTAVAYHVRRVTPERRKSLPAEINFHSVKNRFLLRIKNQGAWLAARDAVFTIPRDIVVLLATATVERSSWPAWRWLWANRRRILAVRQEIQARRVVSDRELGKWFQGL